jgi:hypothetical protein
MPFLEKEFNLPNPDSERNNAGVMLPANVTARLQTVRDVANLLLPQPYMVEVAIKSQKHHDLHEYLNVLHPFFTYAQSLEEEIVNAHRRGRQELIDLYQRRNKDWEGFLSMYEDFFQHTDDLRRRLNIDLPNSRHIRNYEAILCDPELVDMQELLVDWEENPKDDGSVSEDIRRQRREFMRNLEGETVRLADSIDHLPSQASPLQDMKAALKNAGLYNEMDWRALHPWEGDLVANEEGEIQPQPQPQPQTQQQPVSQIRIERDDNLGARPAEVRQNQLISPEINQPDMHIDRVEQPQVNIPPIRLNNYPRRENAGHRPSPVSEALLTRSREDLLLELKRQSGITGFMRQKRLEEKIDIYVQAVDWALLEMPHHRQHDYLISESDTLINSFAKPIKSGLVSEEALSKLSYEWRHANKWLKIGLGLACGVAGMAGGPLAAAVGGGIAFMSRGIGSFAITDTIWKNFESKKAISNITHGVRNNLTEVGGQAWSHKYLNQHNNNQQPGVDMAARTIQQDTRRMLRSSAGLGQIIRGASQSARKRPLHLLGKICVAGGLMWALATDTAKEIIGSIREKISGIFSGPNNSPINIEPKMAPSHQPFVVSPQPDIATAYQTVGNQSFSSNMFMPAVNREIVSPMTQTLKIGNGSYDNCVNKVLRTPVIQEFARQGVDIDTMTTDSKARVLNAVANIANKMHLGDQVYPGQQIELSSSVLSSEVKRAINHPDVSGATKYVNKVNWQKWFALARSIGNSNKSIAA